VEININMTSTGTSAWAGSGMSALPTIGAAPKQSQHGGGLPFAGYAAALAVVPTRVRTADAKVPDPRSR